MGAQKIAAALLTLCIGQASAEVYRWVDENGKTHFTDRADAGTESVNLGEGSQFSSDEAHQANVRANEMQRSATTRPAQPDRPTWTHPPIISEAEAAQGIAECKKNRRLNCGEALIRKELLADKYWKTPEGKARAKQLGAVGLQQRLQREAGDNALRQQQLETQRLLNILKEHESERKKSRWLPE